MSKAGEIESVVARLPAEDFAKLAAWINSRSEPQAPPRFLRDHSAFLNSYDPADEGLYDEAPAR